MTWENVGGKVPNDPVLATDWNNLFDNFQAHADGDAGAPTHDIEGDSIVTSQTNTQLVFAPDGSGGIEARAEGGIRNRQKILSLRETPAKDTIVTSASYALGMESDGWYVAVDNICDTISSQGTRSRLSVQMYTNGGTLSYINASIYEMYHDGGSPGNIIINADTEQAGGATVNNSIIADGTFQSLYYINAGGNNQMWFEVASSGGNTQFRMRSDDIFGDFYFYEVGFNLTPYDI